MYQYLADTNEPYDEALDWAVLFHDIVYDDQPEKELRSAKMFVEMSGKFGGFDLRPAEQARVYSLIMRTVDHAVILEVKGSSAIVRADLHGLTNKLTTYQNFGKIMSESMKLYDIDTVTFAENSEKFMRGLLSRVSANVIIDPDYADFYSSACDGIAYTISLSQFAQGILK
jgi:predicted metal-dependent HD superfamily phosphohydrolase